jgi:hypothetical protein
MGQWPGRGAELQKQWADVGVPTRVHALGRRRWGAVPEGARARMGDPEAARARVTRTHGRWGPAAGPGLRPRAAAGGLRLRKAAGGAVPGAGGQAWAQITPRWRWASDGPRGLAADWHWHRPYVCVLGPVRLAAGFFSSQNVFVNTMMQRDFTYMVQRQRRINMPQALRDLCTVWYEL